MNTVLLDNWPVLTPVWNLPNVISMTRILGVGFIVYFGVVQQNDLAVFLVFVWGSVTDWLDGYLARKLNQTSEFGAALDPIADRLYIIAAIAVLLYRELVPLWAVALVVGRELVMGLHLLRASQQGFAPPAVHYVGKAGTLLLLYAVPFIFLGATDIVVADYARWLGMAFLLWGIVTYWIAGLLYIKQFQELKRV